MNEINPKADIQIAVLVDEKTLLLFGWIDRALPSSGTASFSEGADAAGTYDGHFWPRDEASLLVRGPAALRQHRADPVRSASASPGPTVAPATRSRRSRTSRSTPGRCCPP